MLTVQSYSDHFISHASCLLYPPAWFNFWMLLLFVMCHHGTPSENKSHLQAGWTACEITEQTHPQYFEENVKVTLCCTGSCVRLLLEKDKVGDLNNCALHLRNLWRRWHKGSSYQGSVLLIFVEQHVRSFEDDMICFIFPTLGKQKEPWFYNFNIWINVLWWITKMSFSVVSLYRIWDLVLMKWKGHEKTGGLFTARRVWRPLAWNICLRKMELLDVWVVGWSEVETFLGFIELRKPEILVELMKDRAFHHLMKESENFNSHVDSQNQVIISFSTYFCSFFFATPLQIREVLPKSESTSTFTPWQFLHQTQQDSLGFNH